MRIVTFLVRGKDGWPDRRLPAPYTPAELDLMSRIRQTVEAAPEGSQARQDALNELVTLHELKALLDARLQDE